MSGLYILLMYTLFSSPFWAMSQASFSQLAPLVERWLWEGKDFSTFPMPEEFKGEAKAAVGNSRNANKPYQMIEDVAVIPIQGTMTKNGDWCTSGFIQQIQQIQYANQDKEVRGIITKNDSPGGSVNGIQSLFRAIKNSEKPVLGYIDDNMHSANYWGNAGAKHLMAATPNSSFVGSIGVYMVHRDFSEYNKQRGVAYTYITSDKATHKVLGNPDAPLSAEAMAQFKLECNRIHESFINDVQSGRAGKINQTLNSFNGASWDGEQAMERGLIDSIAQNGIQSAVEKVQALAGKSTHKFAVLI